MTHSFPPRRSAALVTRDLGSQHPIRGVGHLIFREMPRPFRHSDAKGALELGQSVARRGADKEGFLEIKDVIQFPGMHQQLFLGRNIDLVEDEKLRLLRSEEHTSELQSLMRISYAVFCLKKKNKELIH